MTDGDFEKVTLWIVCDGTTAKSYPYEDEEPAGDPDERFKSAHPKKVATIGHLGRDRRGVWYANKGSDSTGKPRELMVLVDATTNTVTGDNVIHGNGIAFYKSTLRRRFQMECPLCTMKVVARGEKVDQPLNAWVEYFGDTPSLPAVPLGWLAAKVPSTS